MSEALFLLAVSAGLFLVAHGMRSKQKKEALKSLDREKFKFGESTII